MMALQVAQATAAVASRAAGGGDLLAGRRTAGDGLVDRLQVTAPHRQTYTEEVLSVGY